METDSKRRRQSENRRYLDEGMSICKKINSPYPCKNFKDEVDDAQRHNFQLDKCTPQQQLKTLRPLCVLSVNDNLLGIVGRQLSFGEKTIKVCLLFKNGCACKFGADFQWFKIVWNYTLF